VKRGKQVVALAGGVGGARLVDGIAQLWDPAKLTTIVNVGDDFEYFGLKICPDLDTVCYTLAGKENPVTGWGLAGESWQMLDALKLFGVDTWFHLGDRDLATHLERTRRLNNGETLSQVTRVFCEAWGIASCVLPVTDDPVPTIISTDAGLLSFQEYFVHRQCVPRVNGFGFENAESAHPAEGVLKSLEQADLIIICPSNPWVSIDPILAIPGIRMALEKRRAVPNLPIVAVSPIIAGKTIKGPAAKMYLEMGMIPSALTVAQHYRGLVNAFVLDEQDQALDNSVRSLGLQVLTTDTIMRGREGRKRLAQEIFHWLGGLL
jgi:LPPG:FO 2-phospho-L-lactate transferase